MLKKENIRFFHTCCSPRLSQAQIPTTPQKMASYKGKKEGKHSLKSNCNRSSISNSEGLCRFSNQPHSRLTLVNQDSSLNLKKIVKFHIQPNATSPQNMDQKKTFKEKQPFNLKENYGTSQQMTVMNIQRIEVKSIQQQKLQKTTRKYLPRPQTPKVLPQFLLQKTKQIRGSMSPMLLGQFKESLVSVQMQNDLPAKIDESIIMIDYFNPTNQKKQQMASYMRSQQ